jgi:hypothetical protein
MLIVKAPKTRRCCSACGKTAALFLRPLDLEAGVAAALAQRLGTERAIRVRIRDMLASRQLLELKG